MQKTIINTDQAPQAIGSYSQAVRAGNQVYISGQIPLNPESGEIMNADFATEAKQVFDNLSAIAKAAGGDLSNIVKLTVYLTNLDDFATLNQTMESYFAQPFPARAAVQISALPKGSTVEVDAIMSFD
ncbi:MAG: RidA family protein [Arenicella sp.]